MQRLYSRTDSPVMISRAPAMQMKVENSANMSVDATLRTIQKKRTADFREDETRLLIQLWGSPSIQNKLFLTHRKAPVMRLLAVNMQQRGFYRTPDEIKTRIRNLKCLYQRIKRSMASGTGIGTVDPNWPHYKAMDEILSKEYPRKLTDRILQEQMETKYEIKIKREIDDIDIDENDSWATNESLNSQYDDDASQGAPAQITPTVTINKPPIHTGGVHGTIQVKKPSSLLAQPMPSVLKTSTPIQPAIKPANTMSTIQLPTSQVSQNGQMSGQKGGIPFPLLILNNLNHADKNNMTRIPSGISQNFATADSTNDLLKELIQLHKQRLAMTKQQIEIGEKRLEFDRVISTQMVNLLPMLDGTLQRLAYPNNQDLTDMPYNALNGVKRKRSASDDHDMVKDSKTLHNLLEKGIPKYMLIDEDASRDNTGKDVKKHDPKHNLKLSVNNAGMDDLEVEFAVDDDDEADKESDEDMDMISIDCDLLEPRVIIEDDDEENEETETDKRRAITSNNQQTQVRALPAQLTGVWPTRYAFI